MPDIITIDSAITKYYGNNMDTFDKDDVIVIINNTYLNHLSYNDVSYRINKIKQYRQQLLKLRELPFVKQRTQEWLDLRKDRLTASDLYDAIKGGANTLSLAKKKANVTVDKTNYKNIPPLKWGTMFEPMAARCYSQHNNNVKIHDFGLICDTLNQHFGASPDGISDMGIMIEIKCPYTRKLIDGFIPPKYLSQIQGQLAVCKLEECDYIECEFKSFETKEEYLNTLDNFLLINHGIIAEFLDANDEYFYIYSNESMTPLQAVINIDIHTASVNTGEFKFKRYIYWYLVQMKIQKVKFNEEEWKITTEKITEFWKKVEQIKCMSSEELKLLETPKKKIKFICDD
jgi:putative phage-type endonuclease